jgi:hypothetical protein
VDYPKGRPSALSDEDVKENKVFVADIFCDFETNLGLLLFGFSDRMRDESYYSISVGYFGHPFLGQALEAQHFIKRPNTRPLLVFMDKSTPERLKQSVLDSQNWFMVDGELDI